MKKKSVTCSQNSDEKVKMEEPVLSGDKCSVETSDDDSPDKEREKELCKSLSLTMEDNTNTHQGDNRDSALGKLYLKVK